MSARPFVRVGIALLLFSAAVADVPGAEAARPKRGKKDKDKDRDRDLDTKPPIITHVRVTRATAGEPLTVRARFDDQSEIFAPSVYVRAKGAADFESLAMKRAEDGWEATIPATVVKQDLEYFIEAFDEQGNGPAREGSPESPLEITVVEGSKTPVGATPPIEPPPKDPPPAKDLPKVEPKDDPPRPAVVTVTNDDSLRDRNESIAGAWWFWTVIGVAVTGGVVATVLVLQNQGGGPEFVDIQVLGPDPTRGLP